MPVAAWLNGPLRPLADALLDSERLRDAQLFQPDAVQRLLRAHRDGRSDNRKPLWTLLVFELWRDQHLTAGRAARAAEPIRVTA
jgi:asparagine synthase (glutamine-hydrolysing)